MFPKLPRKTNTAPPQQPAQPQQQTPYIRQTTGGTPSPYPPIPQQPQQQGSPYLRQTTGGTPSPYPPIPQQQQQPQQQQPGSPYSRPPAGGPSPYPPVPQQQTSAQFPAQAQQPAPLPSSDPAAIAPIVRPNEKVVLYQGPKERKRYENMAGLYAIIVTVEHLENAYVKDAIKVEDYERECTKLIAQYRTALSLVEMDLKTFTAQFKMDCPAAVKRLEAGIPATTENLVTSTSSGISQSSFAVVFQIGQMFLTISDQIELGVTAASEFRVNLRSLLDDLNKIPSLPPDFESKVLIRKWCSTVFNLDATADLTPDQLKQFGSDVQVASMAFKAAFNV